MGSTTPTPVCLHQSMTQYQAEETGRGKALHKSCQRVWLLPKSHLISHECIRRVGNIEHLPGVLFEASSGVPQANLYLPSSYKAEVAHLTAAVTC